LTQCRYYRVSNLHGFGIRQYAHFWPLWQALYGRFDQLSIYWQRNNVPIVWPWPVINVKTPNRTIFASQQKTMVHGVSSQGNKQVRRVRGAPSPETPK
jgi:hypothetical protein